MAVISANISFKRGGHELLDYSSKHLNYAAALAWAQDKNSNAAVGQFIYIEQTQEKYTKGAYVVEAIGEGAVLTPLAKSAAGGDANLSETVSNLQSEVGTVKSNVTALQAKDTEIEAALADKADQSALANLATKEDLKAAGKVKDVTVDGVTVLGEDGTAKIDLSKKADKSEIKKYELVAGANLGDTYASQYEFKVDGEVVTTINIAKDQFLKEAKFIAKASEEDEVAGAVLGDPYLKFTWQEESQQATYVPVKELVKTYDADKKYITIEPDNVITFNIDQLKSDLNSVYAAKSVEDTVASHTESLAAVDGQIDTKIAAHKEAADKAYAAKSVEDKLTDVSSTVGAAIDAKIIDATLDDWNSDKLDAETKAIQAKALKAKFGAMADYIKDTFGIEKVSSLPVENQSTNKVYLLDTESNGQCVENIWLGDKWYVIGSTTYFTKEEINAALALKADKTYVDSTFLKITDAMTPEEISGITNPKKQA